MLDKEKVANLNLGIPNSHNKAVYYVMPLIGLCHKDFGECFLNAYVSFNGSLIVQVKDKELLGEYWNIKHYKTDFDVTDTEGAISTLIVFAVPNKTEMSNFIHGRYSEFSDWAKERIRKYSGLQYKMPIPNTTKVNSHKLLLVLEKSSVFKSWIEKELGETISDNSEFLNPPTEEEFIDIDSTAV